MQENAAFPSPQPLPHSITAETVLTENSASETVSVLQKPVLKPRIARWRIFLGGVAVLSLGVFLMASGAYSSWASSSLLAPNVSIAGVSVGGLSRAQARTQLQRHFGALPLVLNTGGRSFNVHLAEIGGQPTIGSTVEKAAKVGREGNVFSNFLRVYGAKATGERLALPIRWDKVSLVSKLKALDKTYATPAIDARLQVVDGAVQIQPEKLGRELNIGATAKEIQAKYFVGAREVKAFTRAAPPKISAADLDGQDVLLGTYVTRFNPGLTGRTANIHVACRAINGTVLMPGEAFSFNQMTGERTFDKGYRMAHIFETKPGETEAEIVDGLAGGVCQVSSTLFNAVRRANQKADAKKLRILERNMHSLPVAYVPSGLDATVAWPGKDFRFRNTFSHPVYLRTTIGRSKLTIGIWGRILNHDLPADDLVAEISTN